LTENGKWNKSFGIMSPDEKLQFIAKDLTLIREETDYYNLYPIAIERKKNYKTNGNYSLYS
jgi:hypothetical protein